MDISKTELVNLIIAVPNTINGKTENKKTMLSVVINQ